jgi:RNA polymerase sigma-70 factor, ECF subfamily
VTPPLAVSVPALESASEVAEKSVQPDRPDAESKAWVAALRGDGPRYARAVAELHELLLRAARFEIARRRQSFPHLRGDDFDDLAVQSADDALMALLRKIDDYRGASRFTTWAYKFALLEAAVKVRRRAWQGREIPLEPQTWELFGGAESSSPQAAAEQGELFGELGTAIAERLTPHQREVLVAITLNDVPIDILAERLSTSRGALYKTLHDARQKLRSHLADRGMRIGAEPREAG